MKSHEKVFQLVFRFMMTNYKWKVKPLTRIVEARQIPETKDKVTET